MEPNLDALLVLRSCAEHYPPTVNQANLLAGAGLRVGVIDLSFAGSVNALTPDIQRWRVHPMWNSKLEPPYPVWRRWTNWLRFRQTCRRVIRTMRPGVVIGYDTLGSLFVPPALGRYRTIYHFHELSGPEAGEGFGPRRARLQAARNSRHADLVVFPDTQRARIFQTRVGLPTPPWIVMNCPRQMPTVPPSPLRQRLGETGAAGGPLVCYLGSIGADQGLVEAARSLRHWPAEARLVLIGGAADSMKNLILAAAAEVNAAGRLVFLGPYPHTEALALAAGADLGLALIQPNNESWTYSAGAINKRFEYMALGLPQVTNDGPGVREIIEANGCGLCVDPRNPATIGAAIRQLLNSREMRQQMSVAARTRHLETYNYETQFAGVLDWIHNQCRTSRAEGRGLPLP